MRIKKLKSGFEKLTEEKARLLGHLIGDGCVFRSGTDYNIKYEIKNKRLFASKIGFTCLRKQDKLNKYLNQTQHSP